MGGGAAGRGRGESSAPSAAGAGTAGPGRAGRGGAGGGGRCAASDLLRCGPLRAAGGRAGAARAFSASSRPSTPQASLPAVAAPAVPCSGGGADRPRPPVARSQGSCRPVAEGVSRWGRAVRPHADSYRWGNNAAVCRAGVQAREKSNQVWPEN